MSNFLCYGQGVPTLDLEGIHVACLCGPNGHGKSALLDAITWSLWGKARGRTQDELIHHGCDEMLVDLEFLAQGSHHRVTRRHSIGRGRRRQSVSDLQLQVYTGSVFHPITGNSIRETQAKIDQLTGMDYDTFINSAFLLQGRADEFTNKTPGDRKEVLAKILGLGSYDRLQDTAKEYADERKVSAAGVEGELEHILQELSRRDGCNSDLEAVNRELEEIKGPLETSKQAMDVLKLRVDDLRRKHGELEEVKRRIPAIEEDISHLQREMDDRQGRITDFQDLIQEKEAIQEGLMRLQELRRRYEALDQARERFDDLMKRKSYLERTIDAARARLEEQVKQLQGRIETELRPKADANSTIRGKLDEDRARLGEQEKEEQDIAHRRQHLQDLVERLGQLEAHAQQLKTEGQELRSKLDLVDHSHEGAYCPLCGTELGPQGCQRLIDSYSLQREEKLRQYQENEIALKSAEAEKLRLEKELPRLEASLRHSQREAQSSVAVLERELDESQKAGDLLEHCGQELAGDRHRLEEGLFAKEDLQKLVELEGQIGALGYDQETHRRLYGELQELQPFEERHRRLEDAIVNMPGEQESLARAQGMCQRRQEELSDSSGKQRDMEAQVAELPEWEKKLRGAEVAHHDLESRHGELFRRQVGLEGELKKLDELEKGIYGKERTLKTLREQQGIYQELVEAFGKRGIQAMLIETVLPQVEQEANGLLGRMTDNRMHVKLETQRERKSGRGEPIETLEIKISDELGPRSYELFSGGEAFRINLALRIALSKVLASRRGAPLPTLFMDEGFGTQDAAGRERILDVISAIEADFEKIIVITHLDELKEAFQARIEVQKGEAGSTFWISY